MFIEPWFIYFTTLFELFEHNLPDKHPVEQALAVPQANLLWLLHPETKTKQIIVSWYPFVRVIMESVITLVFAIGLMI